MLDSFQNARLDIIKEIERHGLEMTSSAMTPLRSIDFSQLIGIYDHEEFFLRNVFVSSLMNAHQARLLSQKSTPKINAHDVRTAMLMLGSAVSSADEQTFSQENKPIIQTICPYCS